MEKWVYINTEICELEGPVECSNCGFHAMFDATYLDQMGNKIICPSCKTVSRISEEIGCDICGAKTSFEKEEPNDPPEGEMTTCCNRWLCVDCVDWVRTGESETICKLCKG